MTLKSQLLSFAMIAFIVANCSTTKHDSTMRTELAIKSDKHLNISRPMEVTHDVQDKLIKGEASGMFIWIPIIFDAAVTGVGLVGKIGSFIIGLPKDVPYIGEGAGNASATVGNVGPYINNFLVASLANEAESKAVYENQIDGFYRTGVRATIGIKWLIFKEYRVEVTGKPIVIKSLGQFSDARLAKLQLMAAKAGCTTCADIK